MEIILQFLRQWAFLFIASWITQIVLSFLGRKYQWMRRTVYNILRLSVAVHELFHYLMAKVTGAEAKVEYIHAKEGYYQYVESNKTFMKSVLVAFGPSILGAIALFEIQNFLMSSISLSDFIVFSLWGLSVLIFFAMPSSTADITVIFQTISEKPINAIVSIVKLIIAIVLYTLYAKQLVAVIPLKSPYFDLFIVGIFFIILRFILRVIPRWIYKKAGAKNQNRVSHHRPETEVKHYVPKPKREFPSPKKLLGKIRRNPEHEIQPQDEDGEDSEDYQSPEQIYKKEMDAVPAYLHDLVFAAHHHLRSSATIPQARILDTPISGSLISDAELKARKKENLRNHIQAILNANTEEEDVQTAVMIATFMVFSELFGTPRFSERLDANETLKLKLLDSQQKPYWFPILKKQYESLVS